MVHVSDDPSDGAPAPEAEDEQVEEAVQRVEELEEDLASTREEAGELRERLQRLQARFQNFRRRKEREAEEAERRGRDAVLAGLLEIVDNFDRALEDASGGDPGGFDVLELLHKQLRKLLGREGVERVDPAGEPFDPSIHEAVLREETSEHEEGTVVQVLQPGYRRGDHVLRPARVKVAAAPLAED